MADRSPRALKIAYSCNGEGLGHAARLATLVPPLAEIHTISVFAPLLLFPYLRDKLPGQCLYPVPGFFLVKDRDRIRYLRTFLQNLIGLFTAIGTIVRLARFLRRQGFQAVISDFEPLLAWAGWWAGLPVLQINHPGVILRQKLPGLEGILARTVAKAMEGPWRQRLHISFFGGDAGPLVRAAILEQPRVNGPALVVYLRDGYATTVIPALERRRQQEPCLLWEVFPRPGGQYEPALAACRGLITSAGHQALSEALVLGKPILTIPQTGQAEQQLNARMLEASGRGLQGRLETFEADLARFLAALPQLERAAHQPVLPGFRLTASLPEVLALIQQFLADQNLFQPNSDQKLTAG